MKPLVTAILLTCVASSACYTYTPSSVEELSTGDEVRARLTGAQFDELEEHLPGNDRILEGEVVEVNGQGMLLEVPVTTIVEGIQVQSLRQRLSIPAQGMTEVELRALNKYRTYSVMGVAALALGYVIWDQLISDTRRGGGITDPPPNEDRRTVVRIPVLVW